MSTPGRGQHVLFVGDRADLRTIRDLLDRFGDEVYGQVFVEVASSHEVQEWPHPMDVGVTWLVRDRGAAGPAPRGRMAADALSAWAREWLTDDPRDDLPALVWVGCEHSDPVDEVYVELAARGDGLHLHHPHA